MVLAACHYLEAVVCRHHHHHLEVWAFRHPEEVSVFRYREVRLAPTPMDCGKSHTCQARECDQQVYLPPTFRYGSRNSRR